MSQQGTGLIQAAEEFNRQHHRSDGPAVAGSLVSGLAILRDMLYLRLHREVEEKLGTDSLLMPVSERKTECATKGEISVFQLAVSADVVRQQGYLADDRWYLGWLSRLMAIGPADDMLNARVAQYRSQTSDSQRLVFTDVLSRVLPESRRAPLVLFRLYPAAIRIATALAFRDTPCAQQVRAEQMVLLPAIADCRKCQGRVLDNDQVCEECGNPLWSYRWLTVTD